MGLQNHDADQRRTSRSHARQSGMIGKFIIYLSPIIIVYFKNTQFIINIISKDHDISKSKPKF